MEKPNATVIDVIENCLETTNPDRASTLSLEEIDELAERVAEFYSVWSPPTDPTTLTAYSGMTIGMLTPDQPEQGPTKAATEYLFSSLLYYPRVAFNDPIANWFNHERARISIKSGPKLTRDQPWIDYGDFVVGNTYFSQRPELDEARHTVQNLLSVAHTLRDLIREGVAIPVPQWRVALSRQEQIVRGIRDDVANDELFRIVTDAAALGESPTVSDMARGGVTMDGLDEERSRLLLMEAPSYFFNKAVSIADAVGAIYIPGSRVDRDMFLNRIDKLPARIRAKRKIDLTIASDILKVDLPLFRNVSPRGLILARRDEGAFDEFRTHLSNAFTSVVPDEAFPAETSEVVKSALMPAVEAVRRATSRSATLKRGAEGLPLNLLLGAATIGSAALSGVPGAVAIAGAGSGSRTIIDCLYRMVRRPKLQGVNLVVSGLLEGSSES